MCECGQLHNNAKRLTVDQDPTRQGRNRSKAEKELYRRTAGAAAEIKRYILAMPVSKQTVPDNNNLLINREVYQYGSESYAQFRQFTIEVINRWFELGGSGKPPQWFFDQQVRAAYESGAAETIGMIALLLALLPRKRTMLEVSFEMIVGTYDYQQRVKYSLEQGYNSVTKFGNDIAADVARTVGEAMDNNRSPEVLAGAMAAVFSKARSRAKQIAENEVMNAFRNAKKKEAETLAAALDLKIMLLHRSALLPTTRPWHAERHGKVYTIEAQHKWWAEGANLINCKCTTVEVLVDENGKIQSLGMQKKLIAQRQSYFGLAA